MQTENNIDMRSNPPLKEKYTRNTNKLTDMKMVSFIGRGIQISRCNTHRP